MKRVSWGKAENPPLKSFRATVMDSNTFIRNCEAHSLEELAPYQGQYVAWSEDGTTILGHAHELRDLYKEMNSKGITDYVTDWVFAPDEISFGGAEL
ncbi:MAG TPA: hypothetical protein VEL76_12890 [Gemmataceae bacterium]|nr:hypothetical protein [Gemmataceae bacterium]